MLAKITTHPQELSPKAPTWTRRKLPQTTFDGAIRKRLTQTLEACRYIDSGMTYGGMSESSNKKVLYISHA